MNLLVLAIDMASVFLVFSILVSGIQEWIAQKFSKRGEFLQRGLLQLIGDSGVFQKVVAHPLIAGTVNVVADKTAGGTVQLGTPDKDKLPSYIDPENLALALAHVLLTSNSPVADPPQTNVLDFASLRTAIAKAPTPVARALLPILDSSRQDLDKALKGIQDWYSRGMDRVSGWYKAHAQWRLFWIGLVVALLANVNSIAIFEALNRSPELAGRVAEQANALVDGKTELTAEESQALVKKALAAPPADLPIGYGCLASVNALASAKGSRDTQTKPLPAGCGTGFENLTKDGMSGDLLLYLLLYLVGCALTALAGTLGAPYWFAALADLLRIRGSGPTPASRQAQSDT
jgi:hypothetical protein